MNDSSSRIRRAEPADRGVLLALWERSVRATHDFVTDADIELYRPLTAEFLAGDAIEFWTLVDAANIPLAFLGLAGSALEALFVEPACRGRGFGRRLIAHAQNLRPGALTVDVNEQNVGARGFYDALGFVVVGRSDLDPFGQPYPILHMRREVSART
jgi:putative acetyltransferase